MLGYYYVASAVVTFTAAISIPSRLSHARNAGGSFVIAVVFGWLVWPAVVFTAWKVRR